MANMSQRKAANAHRLRAIANGLVRVEVRAARNDASLIRAIAEILRVDSRKAEVLRSALETVAFDVEPKTAFDVFGADLPDSTFSGVFNQPRQQGWYEVDL